MDKNLNLASLDLLILFLFGFEQEEASLESKHFVLFHGSRLSAGCWYKIVRLLRSSGHKVTALDLVSYDIDPLRAIKWVHSHVEED